MTTYLGDKAVGVGTVKATMNVGKVITDNKTISGDGFTEPLAVNTLLFATSESVAASANAVRTEFDGKLKAIETDIGANADAIQSTRELYEEADAQIRTEITNVEDSVRALTKATDDEFVDVKSDISDLKDADRNIRADMNAEDSRLQSQIAGKQDKLTAGEGIKIENNVISATGGGGSGIANVVHDSTLTGAGTSASPLGLSEAVKDEIADKAPKETVEALTTAVNGLYTDVSEIRTMIGDIESALAEV